MTSVNDITQGTGGSQTMTADDLVGRGRVSQMMKIKYLEGGGFFLLI